MHDGLDAALTEVRQELHRLAQAATGPDGQPHKGHGEAAGGMVRVTAINGQLSTVEISPRAMRMPSQDLAAAFATAANAALADLATKFPAAPAANVDLATLEAQLAEVQQQGLVQVSRFSQSVDDALRRFGQ
jgi:hypothetical protein